MEHNQMWPYKLTIVLKTGFLSGAKLAELGLTINDPAFGMGAGYAFHRNVVGFIVGPLP